MVDESRFKDAPEAIVKMKKQFSIVWVVLLVALVIGGWLAYKAISEKGPTITITFETAEGLEAGKRILTLRQAFNVREGLGPDDFRFPKRFEEPLSAGPAAGHDIPFEEMRRNYFRAMGWDPDGDGDPAWIYTWTREVAVYVADETYAGQTLRVQCHNKDVGGGQVLFDNIALSKEPVPEPATLTLLLAGLAALAVFMRKR